MSDQEPTTQKTQATKNYIPDEQSDSSQIAYSAEDIDTPIFADQYVVSEEEQ